MADTADPQSLLHIQVCYALHNRQFVLDATVKNGATINDAIAASGLLAVVEEIDLANLRVGIYGKLRDLESPVGDRDRIEIYRPLTADPMESRRRRAAKRTNK